MGGYGFSEFGSDVNIPAVTAQRAVSSKTANGRDCTHRIYGRTILSLERLKVRMSVTEENGIRESGSSSCGRLV
jgi:hypothetical protein